MRELPKPLFPGYRGTLCAVPAPGVGERYTVTVPGKGDCRAKESPNLPNPPVQFYNFDVDDMKAFDADDIKTSAVISFEGANNADVSSSSVVLDLSNGRNELRSAGGLPDQVMVHADPFSVVDGCPDAATLAKADGGTWTDVFGVRITGKRTMTWYIFDPTIVLRDNTPRGTDGPDGPSYDAGSASGCEGRGVGTVCATTPLCPSAPPTYLNEGRCFLVNDDWAASATCPPRGIYCPGDEGEVASDPFSAFSFSAIKDATADRVSPAHALSGSSASCLLQRSLRFVSLPSLFSWTSLLFSPLSEKK